MTLESKAMECFGSHQSQQISDKCYCCPLELACQAHPLFVLVNPWKACAQRDKIIQEARGVLNLVHRERRCPYCKYKAQNYQELAEHIKKEHDQVAREHKEKAAGLR